MNSDREAKLTDREKVVEKLQAIDAYFRESFNAMDGTLACEQFREWSNAAEEAIALLKAQEAAEPEPKEVIYDDEHRSVYCPSCDNRLAGLTYSGAVALETEETPNYCWMCGQAVKW